MHGQYYETSWWVPLFPLVAFFWLASILGLIMLGILRCSRTPCLNFYDYDKTAYGVSAVAVAVADTGTEGMFMYS